jgi:hypothetical protein
VNLRNFFAELKRCFQKVLLKGVIGNPRVRKTYAQSEQTISTLPAPRRAIRGIALIAVRLKNAFGGRLPHIARIPRGSRSRFGRAWRRWKAVRCARVRKLTRVSGIRIGLIREVSWLSWQRAGRERLQWQGLPSSAAIHRVRLRSSLRHKVCRRVPRCEASPLWSTERRQ